MIESFFISQPMSGREEEEILKERAALSAAIKENFEDPYILDSFLTGAKDVNPLVCLGHAITILSKANYAIFAEGWELSRGCCVEYTICLKYDIPRYFAIKDDKGIIHLISDTF